MASAMIIKIAQFGIHDAAQLSALAIKKLEIRLGQRCLHRSPPAFGTGTFSQPDELEATGLRNARGML
jgi:hypothetical protein